MLSHASKYTGIYEEMINRNVALIECNGNAYCSRGWSDGRRCIAAIARGKWTINHCALQRLLSMIDFSIPDSFVRPYLHHTFLVVRPWQTCNYTQLRHSKELYEIVNDMRSSGLTAYTIKFTQLIPVTTGLLMVGHPSHDINEWRDKFREKCIQKGINTGELYHLDIAHASLFRWKRKLTPFEIKKFIDLTESMNKCYNTFAQLNITGIDIVNASWLLEERDVEVYASFSLH